MKIQFFAAIALVSVALLGCSGGKNDADQPIFDSKVETRGPDPGAPSIEERAKMQGRDNDGKGDGG